MAQPEAATAATAAILAAMDDLGPADARTIAERAGVGYTTAVRKLREWGMKGEVRKTERGSEPAHWSLLAADEPLPGHLQPSAQDTEPTVGVNIDQEPESDAEPAGEEPTPDHETVLDDADDDTPEEPEAAGVQAAADEQDAAESADEKTAPASAQAGPDDDGVDEAIEGEHAVLARQPDADDEPITPPTPAQIPAEEEDLEQQQEQQEEGVGTATHNTAVAAPAKAAGLASGRRPKNYFHDEGLAILRANPEREYKLGEIAKLIAAKEIQAGAPAGTTVSTGALSNAMHKAAAAGEAVLTREKPATFSAA